MTYAYVVLLAKPWNTVTNTVVAINTMCYLFLYSGDFETWELASMIEAVGRCGKVTFPGARCFSWNGMATDMSLCALFLFYFLHALYTAEAFKGRARIQAKVSELTTLIGTTPFEVGYNCFYCKACIN